MVKELIEKRAKIIADARAILDRAEAEGRPLTAEEQDQYDRMMRDEEELRSKIERWAELERRSTIVVPFSAPSTTERPQTEYRKAFLSYLRKGLAGLVDEETRALGTGTGSAGGYLVPREMHDQIVKLLQEQNFVRGLATIITTESPYDIPVESSVGTAAWTSEAGSFTESDVAFGQKTLSAYKLGTIVKVSEELLQDAAFDIEGYLADVFARRFAAAEEAAFVNGSGSGQPRGVLLDAGTGVTAAANNAIAADELISLYYSLSSPYRARAVWVVRDSTAAAIRKLKDSTGQYLWQPALSAGAPDTLLGRPVVSSSAMPAIAANAKSVLLADFSYYYIAVRGPIQMQRMVEAYAASGQVGFRAWERLDGVLTLAEAAKVLVHPA